MREPNERGGGQRGMAEGGPVKRFMKIAVASLTQTWIIAKVTSMTKG